MTNVGAAKRKRGRPPLALQVGKASIRAAALKEFAQRGYKGSSIEAIARSAQVAKPLIYYHFGSKEALWKASLAEAFEVLKRETAGLAEDLEQRDRTVALDRFAESIVRFSANNPWLVRIALDETRQGGKRAQWLEANYLLPLHRMLIPSIERVLLPAQAPEKLAAHVIPAVFGAINFPFIDDAVIAEAHHVDVHTEEYVARHAELVSVILRALLDRYSQGQ